MQHDGIEKTIILFIEKSLDLALAELGSSGVKTPNLKIDIEIPKDKFHGDLSTNIAMKISKQVKQNPASLADIISSKMKSALRSSGLSGVIDTIEVKAPGFINLFFSKKYLCSVVNDVLRLKSEYGASDFGKGEKLMVEFVSANPTGPLTIAHGRQAAIGDSLANILKFLNYDVTREYYLNDEGVQMNILGNSIRSRYLELCGVDNAFPSDGYKGLYVVEIAKDFREKFQDKFVDEKDIAPFREFGLKWILDDIKKDLDEFGVKFDVWYSQRELAKSGKVEKTVKFLKDEGCIFEEEGAVWFESTKFGDDKNRVIVKSDGNLTYLTPDIAYHKDKYERGFKKIIDIWGPDHHGYIPRMKAAIQALGRDKETLSVLIVQLATLYKGGKQVSMSTRAGEFVTLREVMDEVGKDAARFSFLMRRISSHLDFDLDIVKSQSMENPVYYIQYAHARIWSIFDKSGPVKPRDAFERDLLKEPEEMSLLRTMRQFPFVLVMSGRALEPYIVLQYLVDLSQLFHQFYTKHKVLCDDLKLSEARLALVDSVRITLANGLSLLGVSLPKKM